jgi:hypothetical protein
MNESVLIGESDVQANGRADDEIEAMIEELYREMQGTVSRTAVEQTLVALFANYKDAPVQLFVPIIVRRQAKDLLPKLAAETSAVNIAGQPG